MRRSRNDLTLGLILVIALIDALLIAFVRARYLHSHGYEAPGKAGVKASPSPS